MSPNPKFTKELQDLSASIDPQLEEYARAHWGPLVSKLQAENSELRRRVSKYDYDKACGYDISVLMKAISENPAALEYWKLILMLLRLEQK